MDNAVAMDAVPWTNVLGVKVSAINLDLATARLGQEIEAGRRQYVCVSGVHGVMESRRDPALRRIHNQAGLVTPDGVPLVWLSRLAGRRQVGRVYGPDLMLRLLHMSASRGWRHFFYGASETTLERLTARIAARFPGVCIAGFHAPPFRPSTPEEDAAETSAIEAARPDIVWVGLSTPKQERWMAAHRERLSAPLLIGVGAAFDFHAGLLRQAPPVLQRSGLEWAFRLAMEPRRLWRRYLRNNPAFVASVLLQALSPGRYGVDEEPERLRASL